MEHFLSLFTYPFMQNALAASLLAAVACGIVGSLVVCNGLTFLAGGAAHAAYGGIGLALHYRWPMLPCTVLFSMLASLLMGGATLRQERRNGFREVSPDAAVGVLWAAGMAFGIILIQLTPGYAGELMGFLFGSILAVPASDLLVMAAFDTLLLAILVVFRQGLWAISFDREFARARGLPVGLLYLLIVALTATAVVLLIRVVGLILVLALLTIPPFLARRICSSLYGTMAMAALLALVFCLCGLALSWQTDISSGAAIVAVASLCYLAASFPVKRILKVAPALLAAVCILFAPVVAEAAVEKKNVQSARTVEKKIPAKSVGQSAGKKSGKASPGKKKVGRTARKKTRKARYRQELLPKTSPSVSIDDQMEARTAAALATPVAFTPVPSPQVSVRFTISALRGNISSCVPSAEYDDDCSLAEKGIISGFGMRRGQFHKGVDMPAPDGSPVLAFECGTVVFSGRDRAYGICLLVKQDNGFVARYAHLENTPLHAGNKIRTGQRIGAVGRTGRAYGSHLHFELMKDGKLLNPAPYIRSAYDLVPDSGKLPSGNNQFAGHEKREAASRRPAMRSDRGKAAGRKQAATTRKKNALVLARYPGALDQDEAAARAATLP